MNHITFRRRADALRELGYNVQGVPGNNGTFLLEITRDRAFYYYRTEFERTPEQIITYCKQHHMLGVTRVMCPHPGEEGDLGFGFMDPDQFKALSALCDAYNGYDEIINNIRAAQRDIDQRRDQLHTDIEEYQIMGGYKNGL
jgi:hypothetical protein